MRNLVLLNRGTIAPESRTYPDLAVADAVFDPVTDTVTVALTSPETDTVEVQQVMKSGEMVVLALFAGPDAPILSFSHFGDMATLVFVFSNGDIITATYDPLAPDCDTTAVEIVGLIDCGLHAAQWSPDEETLTILTRENNLLLLLRLFEPISEKHLNPDDIKVTDAKHVSVGWGKEETQFKGKGFKALEREREAIKYAGLDLKEDSQLRDPTVAEVQQGTVTSFDSNSVKISWRGDCEYFAITTKESVESELDSYFRRVIRVFNREGELDSVSEATNGLEHNLSWRPSGSVIASTQRFKDEEGFDVLNVAFFERNGLAHGEFNTRLNPFEENVINMEWSSNSDVLALHLKDRVQIWTTKNYHWYLKQELFVNTVEDNEVSFIKFHPEKPLQLMLGTSKAGVMMFNFAVKISSGPMVAGSDVGMTIVIDGTEAKVTPLAVANVPPPIAYRDYDLDENLLDSAVNSTNEVFAFVTSRNDLIVCSISIADMKEALDPKVTKIEKAAFAEANELVKQVCFIEDSLIAVLIDTPTSSRVLLLDVADPLLPIADTELEMRAVLLKPKSDYSSAVVELIDGSVWEISDIGVSTYITSFPSLCTEFEVAVVSDVDEKTAVAVGISSNGKLFSGDKQLATAVTSIKVSESLLAFTNAHSQVCFVHLKAALVPENFAFLQQTDSAADERVRQIERGSILVSLMPTKNSVTLQAPRGNLETICPRIMVLTGVRKCIKEAKYLEAFMACRTHRIDLDLLHDYDPEFFNKNTELFVKQINKVEYLDLFISCLHAEDVAETKYRDTLDDPTSKVAYQFEGLTLDANKLKDTSRKIIVNRPTVQESIKVNKICNAILKVLSKPQYEKDYLQTRVTAYACQAPPNLAGALELIGGLTNTSEQDLAITHLCFLLDVNKLYNHALELYDVKLALSIAQKSQMDPKEYLPFLQNLHVQTPLRKQFLIDVYLKNNAKALQWLFEMGDEAQAEFDDFVVKHELYKNALSIYKYDEGRSKQILALYADYLYDARKYVEAGITYEYLEKAESALESYIMSKRWQEALSIAQKLPSADVVDTAQRLSGLLAEDHKYSQAAEIEKRFLNNIEEAVRLFCKSYQYDSAILLAIEEKKDELIESVVDVQLGEGFGTIAELLADCTSQMNSQLKRLRELRQKKEEDPYAFYGMPNDDMDTPDNVSVAASETSTTPSFFTKYTGKTSGTAKTGASRKTAKNKKREERKRAKGRKGTIYEEEYLIRSVGRLIERLDQTVADAVKLNEGLIRRGKIQQAYQIQHNWVALVEFIKENIVEIHNMSERDRERVDDNGEVYLMEEIPVPKISEFPKNDVLDY